MADEDGQLNFPKQQETENDKIASASITSNNHGNAQNDPKKDPYPKQRKKVHFSDDVDYTIPTRKKSKRNIRKIILHTHHFSNRSLSYIPPFSHNFFTFNLKNCVFALLSCFLFSLLVKTCVKVFLYSSS